MRAFVTATNTYPWHWSPQLVDEWLGDGRAVRGIKHTTVRNYQNALRLFCWTKQAGTDWSRYAPGDHSRRP